MSTDRKGFIGGTDIAVILGISPWKTPLKLWAEKTGIIEPDDLSDNEAVQLGIELEDFVAKKFEKKTGKSVRRAPQLYVDKEHEWMRCQVDRLITGTDELLEVKTASLRKEKEWEGDQIPAHYICQVQWQLMITGRSVGWIAVLIGGQKFVYKRIDADKEMFDIMRLKAGEFWKKVKENVAPSASFGDDETLLKLHPSSNEQLQSFQEMETAIARRQELDMHIKEMEKEKDEIEVKLKEVIGDNAGIKTNLYKVTWQPQSRQIVDVDAMKHDGVYEGYTREKKTRVLRITKNKEA